MATLVLREGVEFDPSTMRRLAREAVALNRTLGDPMRAAKGDGPQTDRIAAAVHDRQKGLQSSGNSMTHDLRLWMNGVADASPKRTSFGVREGLQPR